MIKRATITNFKSLANVTVNLEPVTILIGRIGTGKSNFVQALRFLRDYLTARGDNALQSYGGWQRALPANKPPPVALSFDLTFNAPGVSEDFRYLLIFQPHPRQNPNAAPALWEELLSLGKRVLFHQVQDRSQPGQFQWVQPPLMVAPPAPGNLMLGGLTGIPEVTVAHLVVTNGIGCYTFPDSVLLPGNGPARQVDPSQQEGGLWDTGENYLRAFNAITNNLRAWGDRAELLAAMKRISPSLRSIELQMPARNQIVVSHDVGGRVLVLDVSQESEGFRRLLACLIALYQTPSKQTLIFEEPEKGIHPGALAVLADQFTACPDAGRGQVILTTHSPDLLDHLPPESFRVVTMDNYETQIGPVDPDQLEAVRDQLLRPGELLTVDLARPAPAGVEG